MLLHLVKAFSSVRLYIPKDLRSLDSRQSVGKSVKVRISLNYTIMKCLVKNTRFAQVYV